MTPRALVASLVVVGALGGTAAAAALVPRTETSVSGRVRAELSYLFDPNQPRFSDVRLRILRDDLVVLDQAVAASCPSCLAVPAGFGETPSIRAADLDADGEPEVLLDLYSGGAHCCFSTRFFRYAEPTYSPVEHDWGNAFDRLRDLEPDGRPELAGGDTSGRPSGSETTTRGSCPRT
jgi:hypothetical protein